MIQSDALSWQPDHGIEGQMEEEETIMLWKRYYKKDLQVWRMIWKIGKSKKLMEKR